jgi:F-type H+-transporting ATPase subunit b
MDALGISFGYLFMQIILFVILLVVLRGYLFNPIIKVLEQRKAKIAKGLEDARQASIARNNADAEAKKVMDDARAEAAKVRQEAVVQADEQAKGILAQASEEAKKVVAGASEEAEAERNRILADLRGQVASIAIAAANKLIGESLSEERQRVLIADFFAKVPAGVTGMTGEFAEVTSALPLTDAEQSHVKGALKADSVTFKVDPKILGGLIVRVGDQVVDASVANQMETLGESLK